jgi:predicted RNA-binding Zn-ribbon protein involved in translation (DUF1610 family)
MVAKKTCAKCGAELEWHEQHMVLELHLKSYIKWLVIGSQLATQRISTIYWKNSANLAVRVIQLGAVCPECGKEETTNAPTQTKNLFKCAFSSRLR